MFKNYKKQNINYIETLFTKYKIVNEKYAKLFSPMLENREKIARYDLKASLNCMVGMAYEKKKALEHPYPATKDKIEKYGYDGKQLHHILRLSEFLDRYLEGEDYAKCLVSKHREELISIKKDNHYSLEKARKLAEEHTKKVHTKKNKYLQENEPKKDKQVESLIDEVLLNIISLNLCKQ